MVNARFLFTFSEVTTNAIYRLLFRSICIEFSYYQIVINTVNTVKYLLGDTSAYFIEMGNVDNDKELTLKMVERAGGSFCGFSKN